jgi:PKD repeat protein
LKYLACLLLLFCLKPYYSQCQVFDGEGNLNNTPVWLGCFGTDYTLNIQSTNTFGAFTIDWGDGSPIEPGAGLTPPQVVSHLYPATIGNFTVTFTETLTGCIIIGEVVMEEPTTASIQIPFGGLTQTCAPAPLEFINSSTNVSPTTVFTWDFGDGNPPLVFDYTNAGDTIIHNYLQGTVNCETQVQLTAENLCNTFQGGPSTATFNPIRIWDIDDAAITASDVLLCFPETEVTFTNTTNRNCLAQGNTFQRQEYWNFGDYWGLAQDSIIDWTPWPPTFPYVIDYPGIGAYDVMLIDSNFCGVDTALITINIVPPPSANFSLSLDTVCANVNVVATNLSTGGANMYSWNFGDGSGWNNAAGNPSHSYIAPGDYIISLAASIAGANGCTDTISIPIHVLPIPQANFVLNNSVGCDSLSVSYTDASINAIQWDWTFDNGNTFSGQSPPPEFYGTTGQFNPSLMVTALNGCTDTEIQTLNIYQSPVVSFSPQNVCANALATFTDNSTHSPGDPIITWNWDFDNGDNSTLPSPTTTYLTDGIYNVTLSISTANCASSDVLPLNVEPIPTAGFTQDIFNGCPDLDVNFTNSSTGAVSYLWNFGNGDIDSTFNSNNTFQNSSTADTIYDVSLIAYTTFGCTDTAIGNVNVFYNVNSSFTHDGLPGCAPLDVNFTNFSTTGQTYEWLFGDGATDNTYNTSNQYINLTQFITNYQIDLIVTSPNGCADTSSQNISVYPLPDFSFTTVPDSGCSPLVVNFPSIIGAVSYDWDFGDGNTGAGPSPSHTYVNSSTNDVIYNVVLVATSPFSCTDTNYATVKVFPNPTAQLQTPFPSGCAPYTTTLINNSTGGTDFFWQYGDGNTGDTAVASHFHSYNNLSNSSLFFQVDLIAITDKGCTDTASQMIEVYPEITANFTSDTSGCSPFHAFFTDLSTNAAFWNWDLGNGTIDNTQNPNEYYFNNGSSDTIYTIQLIATSIEGCTDTVTQDVLVYPIPNALFTASPVTQTFPNTTVSINNASTTGSWNYHWDYGNGHTDSVYSPSSYDYPTWGTYEINHIISSSACSDTAIQTINIIAPLPIPNVFGSGIGCKPVTIQFTDSSEYVDSYYWDFGDGGFSTLPNPYYTYYIPGTYTISLTLTGPGGITNTVITDSVEVFEYANAFFQHAPTNVYVPGEPVLFFNLSSDANQYIWDFGDGNSSTLENPEHFYVDSGAYDIMLIANNDNNCPDTIMVPAAVIAETGGEIEFPNAFTPNSSGPSGGIYDPNSFDNDIFFPVFRGIDEYQLMVFNRWGELIFETFDKNVGWDGYYRNQLSQQDVYIWKAIVKFTNGNQETYVGELHLIR